MCVCVCVLFLVFVLFWHLFVCLIGLLIFLPFLCVLHIAFVFERESTELVGHRGFGSSWGKERNMIKIYCMKFFYIPT